MDQKLRHIEQVLMVAGPTSAREICARLDISQATFSRLWRQSKRILKIGEGPSSRYACLRDIGEKGNQWVLFEALNTDIGEPKGVGVLCAIWPEQMVFQPTKPAKNLDESAHKRPPMWMVDSTESGVFPGIPWFLDELVPQGFLGRNFIQLRGKALGLSSNPTDWSFEQRLLAMLEYGTDVPGAYLLGKEAYLLAYESSFDADDEAVMVEDRVASYEARAQKSLRGEAAGSSAGGEQPKFIAVLTTDHSEYQWVMVKFSGPLSTSSGRRWADLLRAEAAALTVLARHGVPVASQQLIEGSDRQFLESERFDRVGIWGRRGMISLRPLVAEVDGGLDEPWSEVGPRLAQQGWISEEAASLMVQLHWFGKLIGNTDMHYGNLSVFLTEERPFDLCPVYDMLPMRYRPNPSGDLPSEPLEEAQLRPGPLDASTWLDVSSWALEYWQTLGEDRGCSDEFRAICGANHQVVRSVQKKVRARA